MKAVEILSEEHRKIEIELQKLGKIVAVFEIKKEKQAMEALSLLDFFKNFADGVHHHKEEELLFPLLEQRGMSIDQGPTAVMRHEHQLGRSLIASMRKSLEADCQGDVHAYGDFVVAANGYLKLLREHIHKEDHCLFPMAEQALNEQDQKNLLESFLKSDQTSLAVQT